MLQKYLELLMKIFNSLVGKGSVVSFSEYLQTILYTFLILLLMLLFLTIVSSLLFGPKKAYIKYVYNEKMNLWHMLSAQYNQDMSVSDVIVEGQMKKYKQFKICYWVLFIFIYIPIAIPSTFYILDLILAVF